jgi:hypothetical protein
MRHERRITRFNTKGAVHCSRYEKAYMTKGLSWTVDTSSVGLKEFPVLEP